VAVALDPGGAAALDPAAAAGVPAHHDSLRDFVRLLE